MAARARQRTTPVLTPSEEREPIIYVRVSTYMQKQKGFSLPHQFDICRHAAQMAGLPSIPEANILHDTDSGSNFQRPALQDILERVRAGTVSVLICPKVDRLGRSVRDGLEILQILNKHNTELILVENAIDATKPMGKLVFTLLIAFAEWELEMIRERTWSGKFEQLSQFEEAGRAPGAGARSIPYGFLYKEGTWERHPDQWRWVLWIYEQVAMGHGGKTVARMLNDRAVPPPRGDQWSPETVRRIVHATTYRGEMVRRMNDQDFTFAVPPIVPPDLWTLANEAIEGNRHNSPRNSKHEYLLSSSREEPLLCCLTCHEQGKDYMMGGRSNCTKTKQEWLFYQCNGRNSRDAGHTVSAKKLEQAVWDALVQMLTNPSLVLENLRKLSDAASAQSQDLQQELAGLEERAGEIRAAQVRLAEVAAWGKLPTDILQQQAGALEQQAQEIAGHISLAHVQIAQAKAETVPIKNIEDACQVLAEGAQGATFQERRWIVHTLVHRIYADKKRWILEGRLPRLSASGCLTKNKPHDTIEIEHQRSWALCLKCRSTDVIFRLGGSLEVIHRISAVTSRCPGTLAQGNLHQEAIDGIQAGLGGVEWSVRTRG